MERVDLVYLWVDGNDPVWQQQKANAMAESGRVFDPQAVAKGRFAENDELRYSLRSVEKFAPWVGTIHIVTADQCPSWLRSDHPKIHLVSHRELFAPEELPTFNSTAIEMTLHKIPGLAERFVFANDDMLFMRPVGSDFFFNEEGLPIARLAARKCRKSKSLYMNKVRRAQRLVEEHTGKLYELPPHHNFDAYLKGDVEACQNHFAREVAAARSHRFRSEGEFHRSAWLYWALAQGRAEERIVSHYGATRSLWERLACVIRGKYRMESKDLGLHRGNLRRRVRKYDPALLCLNDTERTTDAHREEMKALLEEWFPEKSSFEK